MSSITSYKTTAFKESQKFLVIDPSTQSPSLVLGSDLVDYLRPSLNSVDVETTTDAAVNADYDVGKVIQTTGESSPGDGNPGLFLVVAAGTGGIPMLNGNELLVLEGANTALGISYDNAASGYSATNVQEAIDNFAVNTAGEGSDLIAHTGTDDTVTEALDKRTVFVGSVAELEALSLPAGYNVYLTDGGRAGEFVFDSSDFSTEVSSDTNQGIYIAPSSDATGASGAWVRVYGSEVSALWFGAVADSDAQDNASFINAAMSYGSGFIDSNTYYVRTPVALNADHFDFNSSTIKRSSVSFTGDSIVNADEGLNFSNLIIDCNGFSTPFLDRDPATRLSSAYFKSLTATNSVEDSEGGVVFRSVDNLRGYQLNLIECNHRDAARARDCKNGSIVGVVSKDCGGRTFTCSNSSEYFSVSSIVVDTVVQNPTENGGAHFYASGEVGPPVNNCTYSDIVIYAPDVERILVKFSRDSRSCGIYNVSGTVKSGVGFNGTLSAQGSPNSKFKNINLICTQTDFSGTGCMLFCRPHPVTATTSSGSSFEDITIKGIIGGVQISGDDGEGAGGISDVIFKNVTIITDDVAFTFGGGPHNNIQVYNSYFYSRLGRAINTDYGAIGAVTDIGFVNVQAITDAATEAARFPSGTQLIKGCTFKRVFAAGENCVQAQTGTGLVTHNTIDGGDVLYSGDGTLADNFNVIRNS